MVQIGLKMKVSKTFETKEGQVTFDGELSAEEADIVVGIGLNYLMEKGALPFKVINPVDFQPTEVETKQ